MSENTAGTPAPKPAKYVRIHVEEITYGSEEEARKSENVLGVRVVYQQEVREGDFDMETLVTAVNNL